MKAKERLLADKKLEELKESLRNDPKARKRALRILGALFGAQGDMHPEEIEGDDETAREFKAGVVEGNLAALAAELASRKDGEG